MQEFETKAVNVNENMSNSVMLIPGVSSPIGAADTRIAPEVIDEAGRVSLKLTTTLEASANTETGRTTLQDALDGMYNQDGIDKNTLEEPRIFYYETKDAVNDQVIIDKMDCCTGVADDLNSVGSKELNYHDCEVRIRFNRQNPDIASDVGKGDPDDVCAMTEVQTKLLHAVQCHEAETSDLRQFEGMLQTREKQLENDVAGRVRESRKHFQLGTQFLDTASEHGNTHEHSMHSTHTEHQCQDTARITTMTDEQSSDDDEEKVRQEEQGGSKAIYARYGYRMQAMTEQGLRRLVEESTEKYTVHKGRIVTPETFKHLKNHAIVHIVDRIPGEGKKKEQKQQNNGETSSSESDTLADMFFELIQKDMDRMKQAIAVEGEAF